MTKQSQVYILEHMNKDGEWVEDDLANRTDDFSLAIKLFDMDRLMRGQSVRLSSKIITETIIITNQWIKGGEQ